MAEEDEEKTAFITSQGIFCYTKMSFGLKNAGATYQRLVDRAFQKQIGRNLEVYVDDLVIKSHTKKEIIRDIEETFKTLRQINMKQNLKKCTFGMQEGMFWGYKVNAEGLKVCPDKADAVLSLPSPGCLKDIQKMNGKLASLNIFLSKSAEKSLPFFKTLKKCTKKSDFQWTQEGEIAFKQMKKLIAELPMLAVLKEKGGANHIPSHGQGSYQRSLNYRKGRQEIVSVLCEPCPTRARDQLHLYGKTGISLAQRKQTAEKISGRMLKWKFELEGYDIQYRPMTSIKRQILADFIIERPNEEFLDEPMAEPEELSEPWTLFTDGSSCIDVSGAGLILTNPEGVEFTYAMRFRFEATNNEAEYEALIAGLQIAKQMGIKNLQANVDSRLVANQELKEKSIHEKEVLVIVEEEEKTWMTPICEYLTKEILPKDKKKARVVRRKASRYTIINGTLYKKSFLGPWLRCVGPLQANYVLREIHEGSCSMHSNPRSVVAKAIRMGYYWLTIHTDARKLIRECNECQVYRPIPRNPQQNLTPITSPWPFYKWGIDIARPFPEGPGKVKFLIVAIDYFTNWIEAKPVATITGNQVKKFHPQANGLVERANRSLGEGIKAQLDERSKDWIGELSHVLWAHRTMIKSRNEETPFSLTYDTEAVIPAEISMPTLRTAEVDLTKNDEALEINLDLIEEKREQAAIQEAKSKAKMEKYYNSKVRSTRFRPGDMVYRSNNASHAKDGGKLGPKWEGPYEVTESLGKGAYKLKDRNGNELPRTWNICNLKKCYIHEV
ncbi:reverse transcriptase domain-containing protein [Tanacetum coccineum]|uniref:Reverse transcriptase domain-containing protein n=1 Tax=Tanacetum coccineum TaxID=301880 RepID=A0ABQ4YFS1_9ASTR